MLLRGSGESRGIQYDIRAISKTGLKVGVEHEDLLVEFADAVMRPDEGRLTTAREAILEEMGAVALVEAAAVAGNFNQMVRIADSTGIPIDSMAMQMTEPTRELLDINHYHSARNTLGG